MVSSLTCHQRTIYPCIMVASHPPTEITFGQPLDRLQVNGAALRTVRNHLHEILALAHPDWFSRRYALHDLPPCKAY